MHNAEERHTNGLAGLNSCIFAAPLFCFQPLKSARGLRSARREPALRLHRKCPPRLHRGRILFPKNLDLESRTDAMVGPAPPGRVFSQRKGTGGLFPSGAPRIGGDVEAAQAAQPLTVGGRGILGSALMLLDYFV